METIQTEVYNFGVVRWFVITALFYLLAGIFFGIYISAELAWPVMNFDLPYVAFGRIRPMHAFGSIVFVLCSLLAAAMYTVQHSCKAWTWSGVLGWFVFFGFNLTVILQLVSFPFASLPQTVEAFGLVLLSDIIVGLIWMAFVLNVLMTVFARESRRIPVSIWFVLLWLVMFACLYLDGVYSTLMPAESSLSQFLAWKAPFGQSGAMWNLCVTTGLFGVLYYLIPERTGRPLFSRSLAVIHGWALLLIFLWQGLLYLGVADVHDRSADPEYLVELVLFFALLGGALNAALSFSNAWDKLRSDPVLRFFLVALAFYAFSLSQDGFVLDLHKSELSRYIDRTAGNGHVVMAGWFAMAVSGVLYHLVEHVWKTGIYSVRLVKLNFWMFLIGLMVYVVAVRVAGVMQGVMWRAYEQTGTMTHTFSETVMAMHPFYMMRAIGGLIFGIGVLLMLYNILMTIRRSGVRERGAEGDIQAA